MRTSPPTAVEIQVFNKFAEENDIITDGEVGVTNGNVLCNPIINTSDWNITAQTLLESFQKVKGQLKLKSANYKKADALALKLSPEEKTAYRNWAARQRMLIGLDGSEEGLENCASLLGWMRGNPVTAHNLDLALGNITNNIQFGKIHFKPQPREQDRSVVQGKKNHAWHEEKAAAPTREYIGGRKNHAWTAPEDAAKKVAVQAPPDAWQRVIDIQLKKWVTPNQEARLQNEYKAGLAAGLSLSDISMKLGAIVKDRQRGR